MTDTNLVSIERYPAVGSSSHHWKSRLTMTCQQGEEADVFKLIADIGLYSRTLDSQKEMKPPGESRDFDGVILSDICHEVLREKRWELKNLKSNSQN